MRRAPQAMVNQEEVQDPVLQILVRSGAAAAAAAAEGRLCPTAWCRCLRSFCFSCSPFLPAPLCSPFSAHPCALVPEQTIKPINKAAGSAKPARYKYVLRNWVAPSRRFCLCTSHSPHPRPLSRLVISDGVTKHPSAMLGTQLNSLVEEKKITTFSIIKLTKYLVQDVNGRRIIIMLGMDVVTFDHGKAIGALVARARSRCRLDALACGCVRLRALTSLPPFFPPRLSPSRPASPIPGDVDAAATTATATTPASRATGKPAETPTTAPLLDKKNIKLSPTNPYHQQKFSSLSTPGVSGKGGVARCGPVSGCHCPRRPSDARRFPFKNPSSLAGDRATPSTSKSPTCSPTCPALPFARA